MNELVIDPKGMYSVTLSGPTLMVIFQGLHEVPKRLADPAIEELATQIAMLSTAKVSVPPTP